MRHSLVLFLLASAACAGSIGESGDSPAADPASPMVTPPPRGGSSGEPPALAPPSAPAPPSTPGSSPPSAERCTTGEAPGLARLARLTPAQMQNTLAVVFNGRATAARPQVPAPKGLEIPLQPLPVAHYSTYPGTHGTNDFEVRQSLTHLATAATALVTHLRATPGSCLSTGTKVPVADCAGTLAASKGEILFRRPLTAEEVAHYKGVYTAGVPALGESGALALMLQALIMAPQSLFIVEAPPAGGARLGQYEIASSIAYALTDGPADDELWGAARRGELDTAERIGAQVARLLASLDREKVRRFVEEYFEYDGVLAAFKTAPGYDRDALHAETTALVRDLLKEHGRRELGKALLSTAVGYVGATTAPLYGVPAPAAGAPQRTTFPATERAGLLTQPSFLAAFSDMEVNEPVKRGLFVSEKILCRVVPELPIGQVPALPPAGPETPMRARLAEHGRDPSCAACHRLMDPLGLAFEIFEHTGKRRAAAVDASGVLEGSGDQDGPFRDALELVQKLAASSAAESCFVQHSFRYWMGRDERPEDACSVTRAAAAYRAGGGDYVALLQALFTSRAFLERKGS